MDKCPNQSKMEKGRRVLFSNNRQSNGRNGPLPEAGVTRENVMCAESRKKGG